MGGMLMFESRAIYEMRDAFFDAALSGWADDADAIVEPRTGEKVLEHVFGDYVVRDAWSTGAEGFFLGSMMISAGNRTVWGMQYFGMLGTEAALLVKAALRYQYLIPVFRGGRGPRVYPGVKLVYCNEVDGDFLRFTASESVRELATPNADVMKARVVGWCHVQGGLLGEVGTV